MDELIRQDSEITELISSHPHRGQIVFYLSELLQQMLQYILLQCECSLRKGIIAQELLRCKWTLDLTS